jgi:hypothetical protein
MGNHCWRLTIRTAGDRYRRTDWLCVPTGGAASSGGSRQPSARGGNCAVEANLLSLPAGLPEWAPMALLARCGLGWCGFLRRAAAPGDPGGLRAVHCHLLGSAPRLGPAEATARGSAQLFSSLAESSGTSGIHHRDADARIEIALDAII